MGPTWMRGSGLASQVCLRLAQVVGLGLASQVALGAFGSDSERREEDRHRRCGVGGAIALGYDGHAWKGRYGQARHGRRVLDRSGMEGWFWCGVVTQVA